MANAPETARSEPLKPETAVKPAKREQPTTASTTKRSNTRRNRSTTAESEAGGLPQGAVRARYLGTTPEGELVFGLPNNDRVYAAPDGRVLREETTRKPRRARRAPKAEVIEELPVLPALPPDE